MPDIKIISEGKVLSRVVAGRRIEEVLPLLSQHGKIFIVCDEAVEGLARKVAAAAGEIVKTIIPVRASETDKNIGTVTLICSKLLSMGADRDAFLLAIGGGITTDLAGFAASIYKRGIGFGFIPTTLLAQTDAAIGGKNGVNFLELKNMIGVIRQPEFTFICPEPLLTLPRRDFISGSAEMLKTFIIENKDDNYGKSVRLLKTIASAPDRQAALENSMESLEELIAAAAAVKAGVVSRDQFESGERRKLNLGHTFAHAIEHETRGGVSHGEAVAIGTVLAARTAEKLGLAKPGLAAGIAADLEACGLPTELSFPCGQMAGAMTKDKKAENGLVHFVLPLAIGDVQCRDLRVEEVIALLKED